MWLLIMQLWFWVMTLELKIFKKKPQKTIGNKNIITNIYRIQVFDSKMCGYFCVGFIDFMLKGKSLLASNNYEKNDKIILKYFQ